MSKASERESCGGATTAACLELLAFTLKLASLGVSVERRLLAKLQEAPGSGILITITEDESGSDTATSLAGLEHHLAQRASFFEIIDHLVVLMQERPEEGASCLEEMVRSDLFKNLSRTRNSRAKDSLSTH